MLNHLLPLFAVALAVSAVSLPTTASAQPTPPPEPATPPAPVQAAPAPVDLPVRGVTLFSSGVGYFELFGNVNGDGTADLRFKTTQINDILKSLVLQDLDGGKVSSVNYASQEPLQRKLRSFQVDISANPTLADLLAQLRGAKVTVDAGGQSATGTILGVEKRQVAAGPGNNSAVVERSVLTLLAGGSVRSVILDDVRELKLDDPTLQQELARALEALAGARDQEKKSVTLRFTGAGDRRIRVGYVVETPVWKTSYRLLMGEKPSIQGWAIVENQTDRDWNNVQLSLVSGRPISFIQDLYTPLFVPRPVVVPELFASLRPQEYEAGLDQNKDGETMRFGNNVAADGFRKEARARMSAPASRAPGAGGMALAEASMAPMDASASVESIASAAKVGELFQYTVGAVTLPRQTSAMIPIVTDPIEIEKLSIYNAGVLAKNPLNGARVKNTTGKHLLQGPVTVLEAGTYAGDARIDNVPPGQERLLSYGIDLQMTVDSTNSNSASDIQTASISNGVLTLVRKTVLTQEYLVDNKSDAEKTVIIEHPRPLGSGNRFKLIDSPKPIETTDRLHRFKDKIPAGKASKLIVKEETIDSEGIVLLNFNVDDFLRYAQTGPIPQKVKDALAKAAELKRAAVTLENQIAQRRQRIADISQEQIRIRENMKTVQQNSDLSKRLLTKLNDQESAIEKAQSEQEQFQQELTARQKELADYIASLKI